jgi:hypothetical protein
MFKEKTHYATAIKIRVEKKNRRRRVQKLWKSENDLLN